MDKLEILKKVQSGEITPEEAEKLFGNQNTAQETNKLNEYSNEFNEYSSEQNNLNIKLATANLIIESADVSEVSIYITDMNGELTACPERIKITEDSNGINIIEKAQNKLFNFYKNDLLNFKIEIPSDIYTNKINASTLNSGIQLNNISAKEILLNAVNGDILASNSKCDKATFRNVNGDIIVDGTAKTINANAVSGDIKISNSTLLYNSSAKVVSGDIKLVSPFYEEQGYNISSLSGSIETPHESKRVKKAGYSASNDSYISITSVSGDVKIAGI